MPKKALIYALFLSLCGVVLISCNAILGIEQGERLAAGGGTGMSGAANASGGAAPSAGGGPNGAAGTPASGGNGNAGAAGSDEAGGAAGMAGEAGEGGAGPIGCTTNAKVCVDAQRLGECTGGTLVITNCPAGCSTTGVAHCQIIVPTAPVTRADLTQGPTAATTIPAGETRIYTDTGEMQGVFTRAANTNVLAPEVIQGIAYHQTSGVGIFVFGPLTIAPGATVKLIGSAPVALVSTQNFLVAGVIDARPMATDGTLCPQASSAGPGAFSGGAGGVVGPTPMSGLNGNGAGAGVGGGHTAFQGNPGGGGGAGARLTGGAGHSGSGNGGGAGGPALVFSPSALLGGSGGGGGGAAGSFGGGGGGAVQLVAAGVMTIGNGAGIQGVNAGGCGGLGGIGAAGGGAGGMIRAEAAVMQIGIQGTLAANGGGGGNQNASLSMPVAGAPGQLSATPAFGAGSTIFSTAAGNGGAGDSPAGTAGQVEASGGGASAGFLRIGSVAGARTVNAQAVLSPSAISDTATFYTLNAN